MLVCGLRVCECASAQLKKKKVKKYTLGQKMDMGGELACAGTRSIQGDSKGRGYWVGRGWCFRANAHGTQKKLQLPIRNFPLASLGVGSVSRS